MAEVDSLRALAVTLAGLRIEWVLLGALAANRYRATQPGLEVRVLAPEDVILFKLIAGRAQDLADVEAVLAAKPVLDETYLESWAAAWDVLDAWR